MNFSPLSSLWKRGWNSAMLAGVFGTGIRFGANLLLLPIVLVKLSSAELALWWVFVALGNFGNLADFGFGSTIPRIYNYLLAGAADFDAEGLPQAKIDVHPNYEGIRRVNVTVQSLYFKVSFAAMVLLAIGGTAFLIKPVEQSGLAHKVWLMWGVFIIAIGYNLATNHWALALQGLNRMRDLQVVYVFGGVSFLACAALLLFCKMGLMSMVIATFVRGFIMHGRCRQIFQQIVPESVPAPRADPRIVKKLWPNTYKFGILAIGAYCIANGNILICSQFLDKEITASFGLTAQIGNYMMGFASLWLVVKWPQIAILRTQGRTHEMAVLFARRLTLVMMSFAGMAIVVFFAGNVLLALKGTHTQLLGPAYLAFYFIYLAQQIFYVQFGGLAFTENVVPFFKISLFTGVGVILGSLLLTPHFGIWGMLAAPLIAETICSSWYTVRRGFQGQPLPPREFILSALWCKS